MAEELLPEDLWKKATPAQLARRRQTEDLSLTCGLGPPPNAVHVKDVIGGQVRGRHRRHLASVVTRVAAVVRGKQTRARVRVAAHKWAVVANKLESLRGRQHSLLSLLFYLVFFALALVVVQLQLESNAGHAGGAGHEVREAVRQALDNLAWSESVGSGGRTWQDISTSRGGGGIDAGGTDATSTTPIPTSLDTLANLERWVTELVKLLHGRGADERREPLDVADYDPDVARFIRAVAAGSNTAAPLHDAKNSSSSSFSSSSSSSSDGRLRVHPRSYLLEFKRRFLVDCVGSPDGPELNFGPQTPRCCLAAMNTLLSRSLGAPRVDHNLCESDGCVRAFEKVMLRFGLGLTFGDSTALQVCESFPNRTAALEVAALPSPDCDGRRCLEYARCHTARFCNGTDGTRLWNGTAECGKVANGDAPALCAKCFPQSMCREIPMNARKPKLYCDGLCRPIVQSCYRVAPYPYGGCLANGTRNWTGTGNIFIPCEHGHNRPEPLPPIFANNCSGCYGNGDSPCGKTVADWDTVDLMCTQDACMKAEACFEVGASCGVNDLLPRWYGDYAYCSEKTVKRRLPLGFSMESAEACAPCYSSYLPCAKKIEDEALAVRLQAELEASRRAANATTTNNRTNNASNASTATSSWAFAEDFAIDPSTVAHWREHGLVIDEAEVERMLRLDPDTQQLEEEAWKPLALDSIMRVFQNVPGVGSKLYAQLAELGLASALNFSAGGNFAGEARASARQRCL